MQNIIKSTAAVGLLGLAVSLYAGWITPAAYLYRSGPTNANGEYILYPSDTVHFQRAGTTEVGVAWTEAVLWYPNSSTLNLHNGAYPPHGGGVWYDEPFPTTENLQAADNGTHSIQFRLVDNNIDYQDQWLTFEGVGFGENPPDR